MALNRVRFGDYIKLVKEKCGISNLTPNDVSGINRDKEFFEPSKQVGSDTSSYKIVPPNCFACNIMHVGRDVVLPIALNTSNKNKIVSSAYIVFEWTGEKVLLKEYLFIMLKSNEKDRYFWFHCDSSVRDGMDWDAFCDIELEVPSIEIQKKYVAIYEGLLANLRSYEKGLDDLKLVCDGYIEELRRNYKPEKLYNYIEQYKTINKDLKVQKLAGLIGGKIKEARKSSGQDNLSKFQVVYPNTIVYPPPHFGEVGTIGIVEDVPVLLSPMYVSFKAKDETNVNMHYVLLWCYRNEFKRYAFFASCDSIRDTFDFEKLSDYAIPVPPKKIQDSIVSVYIEMEKRKTYLDALKHQIISICPVLIRGSILEAQGGGNA